MAAEEGGSARGALHPLSLIDGAVSRAGISGGAAAAAVDPTEGLGDENKEPTVDYFLTIEYEPFNRQDHEAFSPETKKAYNEADNFFDEVGVMLAASQKKRREECGYVVHN